MLLRHFIVIMYDILITWSYQSYSNDIAIGMFNCHSVALLIQPITESYSSLFLLTLGHIFLSSFLFNGRRNSRIHCLRLPPPTSRTCIHPNKCHMGNMGRYSNCYIVCSIDTIIQYIVQNRHPKYHTANVMQQSAHSKYMVGLQTK